MQQQTIITTEQIDKGVGLIAKILSRRFKNRTDIVFMSILDGGDMFCLDLLNKITIRNVHYDSIRVKSYKDEEKSKIELLKTPHTDLKNKTIVLVDDIYDTGTTMEFVKQLLKDDYGVKRVFKVAFLKRKRKFDRFDMIFGSVLYAYKIYINDFLYGYGMDNDGGDRNLKRIYRIIN